MNITREEIKNLLKEAIEPLERKIDSLNNGFQKLKRVVDFVNEKYDDMLVQSTVRKKMATGTFTYNALRTKNLKQRIKTQRKFVSHSNSTRAMLLV